MKIFLPVIIFALSLSFLLILFISSLVRILVYRFLKKSNGSRVLRLDLPEDKINSLSRIMGIFNFPVSLEISVEQMGKDIHYYAVIPSNQLRFFGEKIRKVVPGLDVSEVDDHQIFHYSGVTLARFIGLLTEKEIKGVDFQKISFDEVNEVAEGAVVQVINVPGAPKTKYEVRILASAPSEYQAREILDRILSSGFSGLKAKEPKNKDRFIHLVNFREHDFAL